MLTTSQYFGKWVTSPDITPEISANAKLLVEACNKLIAHMLEHGFVFEINDFTNSIVGGETLGGFRPQSCKIGAPRSAHKQGMAVDIFDPENKIDNWLWENKHILDKFNLYFEHPSATPRWSHWTIRKPASGRRFFYP